MAAIGREIMAERAWREHVPVLLKESIDWLVGSDGADAAKAGKAGGESGLYVDATLGGGGHSLEILSRLNGDGRLYSLDQDGEALDAAHDRIGSDPRWTAIQGNFGYIDTLLPIEAAGRVNGILLDLGVSTHQIKEGARGFSFMEDGPLDMRMSDETMYSAHEVVNEAEPEDLRRILWEYGEERYSRAIVQAIVAARPVMTTGELRRVVESVVRGPETIKSVARVFQAIRIEVNQELERLRMALSASIDLLAPGGRIVAISYHSLEDRIVKTFFKCGNHEGVVEKDFFGNRICRLEPLTRELITPSEEEIRRNPASRSAKMRVAVRTEKE